MEQDRDNATLEDFYRYFSRWQDAYPGGIPLEYIETPRAIFLTPKAEVQEEEDQEEERSYGMA